MPKLPILILLAASSSFAQAPVEDPAAPLRKAQSVLSTRLSSLKQWEVTANPSDRPSPDLIRKKREIKALEYSLPMVRRYSHSSYEVTCELVSTLNASRVPPQPNETALTALLREADGMKQYASFDGFEGLAFDLVFNEIMRAAEVRNELRELDAREDPAPRPFERSAAVVRATFVTAPVEMDLAIAFRVSVELSYRISRLEQDENANQEDIDQLQSAKRYYGLLNDILANIVETWIFEQVNDRTLVLEREIKVLNATAGQHSYCDHIVEKENLTVMVADIDHILKSGVGLTSDRALRAISVASKLDQVAEVKTSERQK